MTHIKRPGILEALIDLSAARKVTVRVRIIGLAQSHQLLPSSLSTQGLQTLARLQESTKLIKSRSISIRLLVTIGLKKLCWATATACLQHLSCHQRMGAATQMLAHHRIVKSSAHCSLTRMILTRLRRRAAIRKTICFSQA